MNIAISNWPPPHAASHVDSHIEDRHLCDAPAREEFTTGRALGGSAVVANGGARRWVGRLIALALIGGSLFVDRGVVVLLPVLFVLVVPFEKLFPRHRGQSLRRPGLGVDIAHVLAAPLLGVAGLAAAIVVGVLSLAWVPGLALRPVVALIPGAALPFVGIALFDLASYWVHRWAHEVPLLWKFHAIHHSTEHLDWVSGFRNHPFDGAIVAPPFFLLIAAGFDATFTGALAIVQVVTGIFLHANVRWRLKPLHRIVITPEFHHWHHTNEADAHHANYSIFLPLWDTVFGTYFMPTDRRPEVYGIDDEMPLTLWGQVGHPFVGAGSPLALLRRGFRHPWQSLHLLRSAIRALLGDLWRSTTRSSA